MPVHATINLHLIQLVSRRIDVERRAPQGAVSTTFRYDHQDTETVATVAPPMTSQKQFLAQVLLCVPQHLGNAQSVVVAQRLNVNTPLLPRAKDDQCCRGHICFVPQPMLLLNDAVLALHT